MTGVGGRQVVSAGKKRGAELRALRRCIGRRVIHGVEQLRDTDRTSWVGLSTKNTLEVQQLPLARGVGSFGLLDYIEKILNGVFTIRG